MFKEKGRIADLRNIVDYDLLANTGYRSYTLGNTWQYQANRMHTHIKVLQDVLRSFIMVLLKTMKFLKAEYLMDVPLVSDTDTEVIVQLIELFVNKGLSVEEAFCQTLNA